MALSRAFLKGLGLTKEQEDAIVEAHTETVDGLKEQITDIQKKLDDAGNYEKKFHEKETELADYKKEQETKADREAKRKLYSQMLDETKVNDTIKDLVLKTVDYDTLEIDEKGNLKGKDAMLKDFKSKYSKFIPSVETKGEPVPTPPDNKGGKAMTRDEIMAIKDRTERRKMIQEHPEAFGITGE